MGLQFQLYLRKARSTKTLFSTMKAFVAVAMAAAAQAAPEADPQLLLATPAVHVYGNAHTQTMGMVQHANGAVVPDDTLSVKAAKVDHLSAKATAYLNKPLVQAVHTVAPPPVYTAGYSGLYNPDYYNYGVYGAHGLYKREAEAEADPAFYYGNYGYTYPAYTGYTGYNVPRVHTVAKTVVPTVAKTVVQTPVVAKSVVSPFYSALYYGNYGYGVPAYTAGVYNGYTGYTGLNTYAY